MVAEGQVKRTTFSCNLSRNNLALQVEIVSPPSRVTNFHVAKFGIDVSKY